MTASVSRLPRPRAPKPPRPLGTEGSAAWKRVWGLRTTWIDPERDLEHVLLLCESIDERVGLRVKVLRDPSDWRGRTALRNLDQQIADLIGRLGLNPTERQQLTVTEEPRGKLAELRRVRDSG